MKMRNNVIENQNNNIYSENRYNGNYTNNLRQESANKIEETRNVMPEISHQKSLKLRGRRKHKVVDGLASIDRPHTQVNIKVLPNVNNEALMPNRNHLLKNQD